MDDSLFPTEADDPVFGMLDFVREAAVTTEVAAVAVHPRRVHPSQRPKDPMHEASSRLKEAISEFHDAAKEAEGLEEIAIRLRRKQKKLPGDAEASSKIKRAAVARSAAEDASREVLRRRFEQFDLKREEATRETRRRAHAESLEKDLDFAVIQELDDALTRATRLCEIAESILSKEPLEALTPSERAWCKWSRADTCVAAEHPFVYRLLVETAHRDPNACGELGAALAASYVAGDTALQQGSPVPLPVRRAMTLVRAAVHPSPVTLAAVHHLANLAPAITCASGDDPLKRAMLWSVALCALPLMNLGGEEARAALSVALPALGERVYTDLLPDAGVKLLVVYLGSGALNEVWTLRFARTFVDERDKDAQRAVARVPPARV